MLNALFKRLQDDPTFSKTKEMSNDDESNQLKLVSTRFQHAFNNFQRIKQHWAISVQTCAFKPSQRQTCRQTFEYKYHATEPKYWEISSKTKLQPALEGWQRSVDRTRGFYHTVTEESRQNTRTYERTNIITILLLWQIPNPHIFKNRRLYFSRLSETRPG